VYNKAIVTSNNYNIVNSVVVLFLMKVDKWIFAGLEAWNEKWTAHASDSKSTFDKEEKGGEIAQIQLHTVLRGETLIRISITTII
jgi:hypothetical protein